MKIKRTFVLVGLLSLFLSGCANLPNVPSNDDSYSVTWKNHDGTVLEIEDNIKRGEMPTFKGVTPQKVSNEQYDYSFSGWTPSLKPVFQNQVYMAQFEKSSKDYTITWLNHDNSLLYSSKVGYGIVPKYGGELPKKDNYKVDYGYRFIGWSPEIEVVKSNKTYVAQFAEDIRRFSVTWTNYDGEILEVYNDAPYGMMPTYKGDTPTKESNSQYSYIFDGWSPELSVVTGDVSYTAMFKEEVRRYTITWKYYDGEVIEVDNNVPYGAEPIYDGDTPTKESNSQYSYVFDEWSPTLSTVIGDVVYIAVFRAVTRTYQITWINYDGGILEIDNEVPYGTLPTYDGDEPIKAEDEQYLYVFDGWSPNIASVTQSASYTATFKAHKKFTITWVNFDGEILRVDKNYLYGMIPSYNGNLPIKNNDPRFTYIFQGWEPAITEVTGDVTYTAVYSESIAKYVVTWKNANGEILEVDNNVVYGTMPTYNGTTPKGAPLSEFTGWSPTIEPVDGDITYTAVFEVLTNYIIGNYPQSKVTDSELISTLNSKRGTLPNSSNSRLWTSYKYYITESQTPDFMWYIDINEGTEKYRGVYFTSYRPSYTMHYSSTEYESEQPNNEYYINTVYWFKFDPISWDVLSVNEEAGPLMLSSKILDSREYYHSSTLSGLRNIGGETIYPNNYKESNIRKWLNQDFLNTAFSLSERSLIKTTNVDNGAYSTGYSTNAYATTNTNDKLFLPSYREVVNADYGFGDNTSFFGHPSRVRSATDYAKAVGVNVYEGTSPWWLRSPSNNNPNLVWHVYGSGRMEYTNNPVYYTNNGIIPAFRINL